LELLDLLLTAFCRLLTVSRYRELALHQLARLVRQFLKSDTDAMARVAEYHLAFDDNMLIT